MDDHPHDGWSTLRRRDAVPDVKADLVLRECETLLITILGSKGQNEMRFQSANRWEQLREADVLPGGIATKVDTDGFTDMWWRQQAQEA